MKRIILLTETISPYRIPVFNELAQALGEQFLVLFLGETEKRRKWRVYREKIKFYFEVLPNLLLQKKGANPYFFNPTIIFRLMKHSPDIIISSGYYQPSSLIALCYAKFFQKRFILWCESNEYDQRYRNPLKEAYKCWFIKNCMGYIVPGKASLEYLLLLGADAEKIGVAPNAVDNDYFSSACDKYRENKKIFKEMKGYPDKIILYVGRLVDRKGIPDLLKAFKRISYRQPDLGLLIIGSGEEEERYREFCKINNLKDVFFTGFVHQEELPAYYAIADVFVLPTHSEPWGLVLNEAMACKLPVICSNAAGAAHDLIINGENGYTYEKGNIDELVMALEKVLNSDQRSIGLRSYGIIQNFSPQRCAFGFLKMLK
jgi:glycosyltransferase involved in cell wall biosynthesis